MLLLLENHSSSKRFSAFCTPHAHKTLGHPYILSPIYHSVVTSSCARHVRPASDPPEGAVSDRGRRGREAAQLAVGGVAAGPGALLRRQPDRASVGAHCRALPAWVSTFSSILFLFLSHSSHIPQPSQDRADSVFVSNNCKVCDVCRFCTIVKLDPRHKMTSKQGVVVQSTI